MGLGSSKIFLLLLIVIAILLIGFQASAQETDCNPECSSGYPLWWPQEPPEGKYLVDSHEHQFCRLWMNSDCPESFEESLLGELAPRLITPQEIVNTTVNVIQEIGLSSSRCTPGNCEDGDTGMICNKFGIYVPACSLGGELCNDGIDNDCDGQIDETGCSSCNQYDFDFENCNSQEGCTMQGYKCVAQTDCSSCSSYASQGYCNTNPNCMWQWEKEECENMPCTIDSLENCDNEDKCLFVSERLGQYGYIVQWNGMECIEIVAPDYCSEVTGEDSWNCDMWNDTQGCCTLQNVIMSQPENYCVNQYTFNGEYCSSASDMYSCFNDPNCSWSETDQQCYPDVCGRGNAMENCDPVPGCEWNEVNGECESLCRNLSEQDCLNALNEPYCNWVSNESMCVMKTCGDFLDDQTCNADPLCDWDYSSNSCYKNCFYYCSSQGCGVCNERACRNDFGCTWDDFEGCIEAQASGCGDGVCDVQMEEDTDTCPEDCYCGDGVCDQNEDATGICPPDCGDAPPECVCGDDYCNPDCESTMSCPDDCGGDVCGDGVCGPTESPASCPPDCGGDVCGDGVCGPTESPINCLQDCAVSCEAGPGDCQSFEQCCSTPDGYFCVNTDNHPQHCGECNFPCAQGEECVAGNCEQTCTDECDPGEIMCDGPDYYIECDDFDADGCTEVSAPMPCPAGTECIDGVGCQEAGAVCGDGICDTSSGEDAWNCSSDCPAGVCGTGICDSWEDCESCPSDCGECPTEVCSSNADCTYLDNPPCIQGICEDPEYPGADSMGCVASVVPGDCDDGNPCTIGDTCQGDGTCIGTPLDCGDDNPCTQDYCDPSDGTCYNDCIVGNECEGGTGTCMESPLSCYCEVAP